MPNIHEDSLLSRVDCCILTVCLLPHKQTNKQQRQKNKETKKVRLSHKHTVNKISLRRKNETCSVKKRSKSDRRYSTVQHPGVPYSPHHPAHTVQYSTVEVGVDSLVSLQP